jgi:cytochrome c peroxidase
MRRWVWILAAGCGVLLLTLAAQQRGARNPANAQSANRQAPDEGLRQVEEALRRIDRYEQASLAEMRVRMNSMDPYQQNKLLGRLLLNDRNLSVNRNTPCVLCHTSDTGFTGPSSFINSSTVSYPGSVRTRRSGRRPQSYSYAPYAPVLHYDKLQQDFIGGNFWDMRATGLRVGSPAAAQAEGPPVDQDEMGFRDYACVVYRMSQQPYRPLFEKVWGSGALAFAWPADADSVCNTVWDGAGPQCDRNPHGASCLNLPPPVRTAVKRAFDEFATSIAVTEASDEVSPFTSKFDAFEGGSVKLTPDEQAGMALFNGKARCSECHRSSGQEPLFTDFTAVNLGIPTNPEIPAAHIPDYGVGAFLANPDLNPNYQEWRQYAPRFMGKFQVATARNADMRPDPSFVKAYMHNGYLKSLKDVVHFYNTRDTLPRCKQGDPGERITCWPPPEVPGTVNRTQLGHLGLTDTEENDVVAFLRTLTDGYHP